MESHVYDVLNTSYLSGDTSKAANLGAYSAALYEIISGAQFQRKDIEKSKYKKCDLYKGTGMTKE